jgi:uncharacterized protein (DUF697 family)/tellurite resistance protein
MNDQERQAIASIALLAAFADGNQDEAERAGVRLVAQTLQGELPMAALYRDVLLKKTTIENTAALLATRELKQLAYELALGVTEADGMRNDQETAFLARLAKALGLDAAVTRPVQEQADALATMPLESGDGHARGADAADAAVAAKPAAQADEPALSEAESAVDPEDEAAAEVASGKIYIGTGDSSDKAITGRDSTARKVAPSLAHEDETDKMIVNASVMNGALELLPQSLASMAIIALQLKLVYRIGKTHGYELDRGHAKDLLATMGAGVTGQYLEDIGRKLLGGLFGKAGGRVLGGLAGGATGMAFSFASTWAIGQVAKRYYAGGRTMSADMLRTTFADLLDEAKSLQSRYAPQIEQQAKSIDMSKIVELVRSR